MQASNRLLEFLEWVKAENAVFKEFNCVRDLHYFLLGYQMAESNNIVKNGCGSWISDFMIFCQKEIEKLDRIRNNEQFSSSGIIYYRKIMFIQKDDHNGLQIMFDLLNEFLKDYKSKLETRN